MDVPYPGIYDILTLKDTMIIGIPAVKRKKQSEQSGGKTATRYRLDYLKNTLR